MKPVKSKKGAGDPLIGLTAVSLGEAEAGAPCRLFCKFVSGLGLQEQSGRTSSLLLSGRFLLK